MNFSILNKQFELLLLINYKTIKDKINFLDNVLSL